MDRLKAELQAAMAWLDEETLATRHHRGFEPSRWNRRLAPYSDGHGVIPPAIG